MPSRRDRDGRNTRTRSKVKSWKKKLLLFRNSLTPRRRRGRAGRAPRQRDAGESTLHCRLVGDEGSRDDEERRARGRERRIEVEPPGVDFEKREQSERQRGREEGEREREKSSLAPLSRSGVARRAHGEKSKKKKKSKPRSDGLLFLSLFVDFLSPFPRQHVLR